MRILCVLCVRGALGQSVGARLEFTTFGKIVSMVIKMGENRIQQMIIINK